MHTFRGGLYHPPKKGSAVSLSSTLREEKSEPGITSVVISPTGNVVSDSQEQVKKVFLK